MTSNQIESFLSIIENKSFNQAEKKLFVSRQALKKQIDSLEAELGFTLFVRAHSGISLTPVGQEFYDGIVEVNDDIKQLVSRCRNLSKHEYTIRIGSPAQPRLILEKAFNEFSREYPYIKQEVIFIDEPKTLSLVLDGTVDVAECIWSPIINNSKIEYYKLADMPYKCLVTAGNPLASKKEIVPADLEGYTVGVRSSSNVRLIRMLKDGYPGINLIETKGSETEQQQIYTVCYNQGVFISRAHYANHMEPLVTIPFATGLEAECGVIYKKSHSSIVTQFIDVVRSVFTGDLEA